VADLVAAVGFASGGAPDHVKVFSGASGAEVASFYAFDPATADRGGLSVAAGDVNGDGFADVIVGLAGANLPHVKVFDGTRLSLVDSTGVISPAAELGSFYAFELSYTGGVTPGGRAGDVDGDGRADVVVGTRTQRNEVRVFNAVTLAFPMVTAALPPSPDAPANQGVNVAAGDLDNDGKAELFTAPAVPVVGQASGVV